ncbi:MAG TPA: sigma 54-interacting transcriptional regulator [Gemmatimonadaceae bacterium]|jgi:DNA-binding NtrC family response regulator|nr:sigma 54-interacting transcriptional regulator [Gemmatimonadaceae bacterium]
MKQPSIHLEATLLGESKAIRALRTQVRAAAAASLPVLLHGPAGSGKELTAWAIHAASQRRGPFVPFPMSHTAELILRDMSLDTPETRTLLPADAHTFGGGTVFLHEIAQLQASSQTLLLQAFKGHLLDHKRSADDPNPGMRLIAATSSTPQTLLQSGHFQERLLRRLSGITIAVPSLTERRKDIPTLAIYFLSLLPSDQRPLGVTAAAIRRLQTFEWPENIRELKRVIIAAAKLAPGEMLDEMTIEFARKTADCRTPRTPAQAPASAPIPADVLEPPSASTDVDQFLSQSYRTAKGTVARWLRPSNPTPRYPRLTPPRPRVP